MSEKRKGKQWVDLLSSTKSIEAVLTQAMVGLNQQLNFINEGIEVVSEEMRSGFVLAEETKFTEMEKMLWQYNTILRVFNKHMDIMDTSVASHAEQSQHCCSPGHGQQHSKPASNLIPPPIQPASSTSGFPPALASTLAPIAEAEEPNNNKGAQPKEDESKMDHATAVATTVDQSAIADDFALISNSIASHQLQPTASIIDSAITTNSVTPTRPAASITDFTVATRLAASNESTGVESILASPIAITGQLMDVDMTGPAPPHASDEIVP
ncbi:hypothetical protein E4T56_gene266 [Termitomyces sp. T112]|nr:hypothetical protein E4T56_gene266 [Termitomyces sp. T112]